MNFETPNCVQLRAKKPVARQRGFAPAEGHMYSAAALTRRYRATTAPGWNVERGANIYACREGGNEGVGRPKRTNNTQAHAQTPRWSWQDLPSIARRETQYASRGTKKRWSQPTTRVKLHEKKICSTSPNAPTYAYTHSWTSTRALRDKSGSTAHCSALCIVKVCFAGTLPGKDQRTHLLSDSLQFGPGGPLQGLDVGEEGKRSAPLRPSGRHWWEPEGTVGHLVETVDKNRDFGRTLSVYLTLDWWSSKLQQFPKGEIS